MEPWAILKSLGYLTEEDLTEHEGSTLRIPDIIGKPSDKTNSDILWTWVCKLAVRASGSFTP